MLNPSAERELTENYRLSTEKARQWWNNQAFESRKNIVIESDAVINDDQEVEDQIVADVADSDYDELPDETKQEIDVQIDEEEDIEEIFEVQGEEYLQCSKCDDLFTSNEDYDIHKSVDHGEEPENFEESDETYQLAMNPDLTRESLRKANSLLTETEEKELYGGYDKTGKIQSSVMPYNVPAKATGKYNDNPNEFFYSNKIFRNGSSTERNSALGEAKVKAREWELPAELQGLIPNSGSVSDPDLEELRKAMNTYYEVSNNGGGNWYDGADGDTKSLMQNYNLSNTERLEAFHVDHNENPYDNDGYDIEVDTDEEDRLMRLSMAELETIINQLIENAKGKRNDNNWNSWESKASESLVYAKIFKFSNDGMFGGEIQLVAEGKNKKLTEEESLRIKDQYNMKTESGGYSGYVDESEFGIGESKASETIEDEAMVWYDSLSYNDKSELNLTDEQKKYSGQGLKDLQYSDWDDGWSDVKAHFTQNYYKAQGLDDEQNAVAGGDWDGNSSPRWSNSWVGSLYGNNLSSKSGNKLNFESKASEDDYEERAEWNWLTNKDSAPEVDYGQVDYEDDGVSDISVPNAEPKDDKNEFLDDVDIKLEEVNFVYPTKSNESTKSYIKESEPFDEEYEEFEDSDEEIIEETITVRKLTGYSDNSIAQELHINYGVSHEEALEKVYNVEVSTNDKVAQTFFGKMYKQCTESEKDELRMYSGSD